MKPDVSEVGWYSPFRLIRATFEEYTSTILEEQHRQAMAADRGTETIDLSEFDDNITSRVYNKSYVECPAFETLLGEETVDRTTKYGIAFSLISEYGYEELKAAGDRKYDELQSDESVGDPLPPTQQYELELIREDLGADRVQSIVREVVQSGGPTRAGRSLIRELGGVRDLTATPLFAGEKYYRERRAEIFGHWRDHLQSVLPGSYISEDTYEQLSLVERDALCDHLLYKIDFETYWDCRGRAKEADLHSTEDQAHAGLLLNHLGTQTIEDVADQIQRVDLEAIDIDEEVVDPDLKPLERHLVDGEWPDWDLPVMPRYVRETRGETEPDPISVSDVRFLDAETVASRLRVDQQPNRECSAYRITRIEPGEDAMLLVDTYRGEVRWAHLPKQADDDIDEYNQGALVLAAIDDGNPDTEPTVAAPDAADRWTVTNLERISDTTLTFYEDVGWMPDIADAAAEKATDGDRGLASTFLREGTDYDLEVHVSGKDEKPLDLYIDYRTGRRVLEDLYDSLDTGYEPAQDIMVVLPAHEEYMAIFCFGSDSTVVDEFHESFRSAREGPPQ